MSEFSTRWDNCTPVPLAEQFFPLQRSNSFHLHDGQIVWEDASGVHNVKRLFECCAPLSSIILKMAEALSSGNLEVLNANNLKYVRGRYKEWEKVFNRPNPI